MATQFLPTSIVPEILRGRDNYEAWSACLRSYLLAQDLWEVVTGRHTEPPQERTEQVKDWAKRNAAALHAIQVSCGPVVLSMIREITKAEEAWDILALRHRLPESFELFTILMEANGTADGGELVSHMPKLQKYVSSGNWEATKLFLDRYPEATWKVISKEVGTALHVAVKSGHLMIVKELLSLMTQEADLEIKDSNDFTALDWAVAMDNVEMVESMLPKYGSLPPLKPLLMRACEWSQNRMASYLYQLMGCRPADWSPRETAYVIAACIQGRIFDIALDLLSNNSASELPPDDLFAYAALLATLSNFPGLFPSGLRLSFWQRWIYLWMRIQPFVSYHRSADIKCKIKPTTATQQVPNIARRLVEGFLEFFGIKQIYKLKHNHVRLLELIDHLSPFIELYFNKSRLRFPSLRAKEKAYMEAYKEQFEELIVDRMLMNAVKFGIVEIVLFINNLFPDLPPLCQDENGRTILESSIKYRQEKIFGYFVPVLLQARNMIPLVENQRVNLETLLHLAGEQSPSSKLSSISGAALQMQRELQWYSKVESFVTPQDRDRLNNYGETAREVFTREHKDLRATGEAWMTSKATSCTVVGALIITVMFAAAFTVPGGLDQRTGLPLFQKNKWFKVFIINDAISLFTSSTSVLMFLGILTSRYAEQDFLKSLPTKLIIGISTLLLSIAAMMVAFCATLIIVLGGQLLVLIPIISLAAVPVITFMSTQFPLLLDIYKSTYFSSIFEYKKESYPIVNKLIERRAKAQVEEELQELKESITNNAIV